MNPRTPTLNPQSNPRTPTLHAGVTAKSTSTPTASTAAAVSTTAAADTQQQQQHNKLLSSPTAHPPPRCPFPLATEAQLMGMTSSTTKGNNGAARGRNSTGNSRTQSKRGGGGGSSTASSSPVAHGFVGFFDAELYGGVMMSTLPPHPTPGLYEWFPMLFPARQPVKLPVELKFSRRSRESKVWYEWGYEDDDGKGWVFHNPSGRQCSMRLWGDDQK